MCHGDIGEEFPEGLEEAMRDCSQCHQAHRWEAEIGDCAVCHGEAVADAERIEEERYGEQPGESEELVKRECTLCHVAHEWRIEPGEFDCTICHGKMETGLHNVAGHQECLSCHGEHTWQPRGRELCARCHSDREDHYPDTDCVSCHWSAGKE
jgi:hypothetical protein